MKVKAYRLEERPFIIKPGERKRQWMDETPGRYAYRCLPLSVANSTGWDLYCDSPFVISWNGGSDQSDISINYAGEEENFITSTFGAGIVTFHTGWLFRTDPEWDMLVTGPINDGISWANPLSGIVETWWNDFTFTMNWKLHTPGSYFWNVKTPICRLLPIPHEYEITTEVCDIESDVEQKKLYDQWAAEREQTIQEFNQVTEYGIDGERVKVNSPKTEWEGNYYKGVRKNGERISKHTIKRDFPEFQ